jgi:hypothetical protein
VVRFIAERNNDGAAPKNPSRTFAGAQAEQAEQAVAFTFRVVALMPCPRALGQQKHGMPECWTDWPCNESETAAVLQANKVLRKRVKTYMKKIGAIVVAALLSLYAVGSADAAGPLQEGPLHWTARHVRQAAVETGDTLSNVARTTGRAIHHGTRAVRQTFR